MIKKGNFFRKFFDIREKEYNSIFTIEEVDEKIIKELKLQDENIDNFIIVILCRNKNYLAIYQKGIILKDNSEIQFIAYDAISKIKILFDSSSKNPKREAVSLLISLENVDYTIHLTEKILVYTLYRVITYGKLLCSS